MRKWFTKHRFTKGKLAFLTALVAVVTPLAVLGDASPASAGSGCSGFTVGASTQFLVCFHGDASGELYAEVTLVSGAIDGNLQVEGINFNTIAGCTSVHKHITGPPRVDYFGPSCHANASAQYRATWLGSGGLKYSSNFYTG